MTVEKKSSLLQNRNKVWDMCRCKKTRFCILFITLLTIVPAFTFAEKAQIYHPTRESGSEVPPYLKGQPTVPKLPTLLPPTEKEKSRLPLLKVFVREINVTGSTVFSPEQLSEITAPYISRELTSEDLESLRRSLTIHYVNSGYINSGAVIPDQTVVDGVIELRIIEGELTRLDVTGCRWFRPEYFKNRFKLISKTPLNIYPLQQQLQLFQQDPRIRIINAELKPGTRKGESELHVDIKEHNPMGFQFLINNYQPPSVGAEEIKFVAKHQNLFGYGDTLSVNIGKSFGISPEIEMNYRMPITRRDTTASLRLRRSDFFVVEEPFGPLDIETESDTVELTIRHPFYRTVNHEFAMSVTGEYIHNETSLLGEPYSFTSDPEDDQSTVVALRFGQEWTSRNRSQVYAIRSRFSLGVDGFGATIKEIEDVADNRFFSWLGQFQWAKRLNLYNMQILFRTDVQLTDDQLLSSEQMVVGGRYSVRGYRENTLVRDTGAIGSLELRVPLIENKQWADYLELAPFVDYGWARNNGNSKDGSEEIACAGIGLRWAQSLLKPYPIKQYFEIYWAIPFRNIETSQWNLQDEGIHFQFVIDI